MTTALPETVVKLESLIPIIQEKAKQGLIKLDSYNRAVSLVAWGKNGRPYSEAQLLLVGKLIERAERRHRKASVTANIVQTVDHAKIVEDVLARIGEQKVDAAKVAALVEPRVLAALDARKPVEKVITIQRSEGKKTKVTGPRHAQFERLLRAATSRLPSGYAPGIFLQGEASSGKTTGARHVAEALKLDWFYNGAISFPHEMLGFIDGAGKYHRTPFRDAYEKGGVYTFDEVDRSDPVALLAVNPHLAGDVATFPDKQVKRHPDCIITATANTWGLGADAHYSGATKLDAAFLSRFPVRISWDIDPLLEEAIVPLREWLNVVRAARVRARAVGLKVLIDTRVAQAGAALIASGYSVDEAADMTFLANLKPEQRKQIHG